MVTLLAVPLLAGTGGSTAAVESPSLVSTARAGGTLAYLESRGESSPNPVTDLFVVNADGSRRRRVPGNQVDAEAFEWSPDGRRFVFGTPGVRGGRIVVMNRDGSRRRALASSGSRPLEWTTPSWSPDGRRILYHGFRADWGSNIGIYAMNADGTGKRRLTRKADRLLSWSPDRRRIAFVRTGPELWVMNADGTGQRRLYSRLGDDDRVGLSPNWRKLVIVRKRRGEVRELFVMNTDGTGARRLARGTGDFDSSWSPDSREIAFERGSRGIWAAAADGTGQRRLISGGSSPLWSLDGRLIAFWRGGISVATSTGLAQRLVVPWRGEITNIRWAPRS